MSKFLKCFFGVHQTEIIEQRNMTNHHNEFLGIIYITRCENCGEIKEKFIPTKIEVYDETRRRN